MKTRFLRTAAAMALLAVSTALAAEGQAADPTITLQATCPVMGGAIDRKLYVDHEGQRIYVCCAGCIDAVKKDPAKALRKLEAAGVTVAKLQTTCPVMGGAINRKLYVDHEGQRIYVCCAGCIDAVKKDPAAHVKAMQAKGVALEASPVAAP